MFAGYSVGRSGASGGDDLSPRRSPGAAQTIVLFLLGMGSLGAAFAVQGSSGVRLPTPHRLRELEDRIAEDMSPVESVTVQGADPSSEPDPSLKSSEHTS